jgi:transitional endoplasmic reticulum ATPase
VEEQAPISGSERLTDCSDYDVTATKQRPLLYASSYKKLGITAPRGVLLYGPPGCAKTTMVRALANSCQATFHSLNGAQIFSPYLGDAEQTVRDTFKRARLGTPAILFLDEVDAIVGNRAGGGGSGESGGVQERVLSTLLNEMDGTSFSTK